MTSTEPAQHLPTTSLVAAGVLFTDDAGRVMLVRPTYKEYWDIPGGYVEPGETPMRTCVREVQEELGIRVEVGPLLSVDWAPHPDEGDKVLFIFDGGRLAADTLSEIDFVDGEISEYAFVAVNELEQFTIPRLARRLHAASSARESGRPLYLEHGTTPACR